MKKHFFLLLLPGLLLAGAATAQTSSSTTSPTVADAEAAPQNIGPQFIAPTQDIWEQVRNISYSGRAEIVKRMEAVEVYLQKKLPEWEAKKDSLAAGEAKDQVGAELEEFRTAHQVFRQKVRAVDSATVETWDSVKSELNSAWQRMKTSYKKLETQLGSSS